MPSLERTSRTTVETSAGGAPENFSAEYPAAARAGRSDGIARELTIATHTQRICNIAWLLDFFIDSRHPLRAPFRTSFRQTKPSAASKSRRKKHRLNGAGKCADERAAPAGVAPVDVQMLAAIGALGRVRGHGVIQMRCQRRIERFFVVADFISAGQRARGDLHKLSRFEGCLAVLVRRYVQTDG